MCFFSDLCIIAYSLRLCVSQKSKTHKMNSFGTLFRISIFGESTEPASALQLTVARPGFHYQKKILTPTLSAASPVQKVQPQERKMTYPK